MADHSEHFTKEELACSHCGICAIVPRSLELLETVRRRWGLPMILTSAYRCPEYNAFVSSTGDDGPHVQGRAFDVQVYGAHAYHLTGIAMETGFTGIGWSQKGPHEKRFIHIDDLPALERPDIKTVRPWTWTYA